MPRRRDARRCRGEGGGGRRDDDGYGGTATAAPDEYYRDRDDGLVASVLDVDLGVEQRVAGSDVEQSRTRNVLRKMAAYFEDEVLSRSEYEHVRGRW